MPERLACRSERVLADPAGRVHLVFTDADGPFTLLVELKLHSGYGHRQLERYLSSLSRGPTASSGWPR